MIDICHLDPSGGRIWVHEGQWGTANPTWKPWHKPRGKSFLYCFMTGGGGGGGGGFSAAAGSSRGGGGSGGGAGFSVAMFPLALLPDTLYVQAGAGGLGGAAGAGGISGGVSLLCIRPFNNPGDCLLTALGGGNGGGSSGSSGGTGGSAGTAASPFSMTFSYVSIYSSLTGGNNGNAGATAAASGATPSNRAWGGQSYFCLGGGSGASTGTDNLDFAGAAANDQGGVAITYSNSGFIPNAPGGIAGGGRGADGCFGFKPLFAIGGGGGGTNGAAGVGGAGGHGRWGCGGGGGGGGVTGGAGGNGGNAVVLLLAI